MKKSKNNIVTPNAQIIGNVGLHYVCYRLSRLGWNVMPTTRNAKGIDIVIYNHDASQKLSIQVKALSKRSPVPFGSNLDHLFADYIIICRNALAEKPECFILMPREVRKLIHRGEKEGKISYWLQPRNYEVEKYREVWDRIGSGI